MGLKELEKILDTGIKEVVETTKEGTLRIVEIELVRQGILDKAGAKKFIDRIPKFKLVVGKKKVKP